MGDALPEIGDLLFSLVIGYLGALEFLYVARHLYHWTCRHPAAVEDSNKPENLQQLQDGLKQQLAAAKEREAAAGGAHAMVDGVLYKDGYRVDPQQGEIDALNEQVKGRGGNEGRQQALASELAEQRRIEEATRKELEAAEAKLARQRRQSLKEAEENSNGLLRAERAREDEQRRVEEDELRRQKREAEREREDEQRRKDEVEREAAENERRLFEAERQRVEDRRREEEEAEMAIKLIEAERQQEEEQRRREEEEENERKLLEAEMRRDEEQRLIEEAEENERREKEQRRKLEEKENERKLLEAEKERDEEQRLKEEAEENESALIAAEREREEDQRRLEEEAEQARADDEIVARLLEAELERQEREYAEQQAAKQRHIDDNALKFLEAEEEMISKLLQQQQDSELTPVVEQPCIKKIVQRKFIENDEGDGEEILEEIEVPCDRVKTQTTVKTQFGQTTGEPFAISSKSLQFSSLSDEGSSVEPQSSSPAHYSSLSTQPSDEASAPPPLPSGERQEPEGEDTTAPTAQQEYSEEYLRSLDGIKSRSLIREDGSGRRRAFKKRRSSGSSNSSRDSRTSREEEVKMFTSLEEEEKSRDDAYTPIKYSNDQAKTTTAPTAPATTKVKGHHHRRHKRSPAKEVRDEATRGGSLEMLGEEAGGDPWGEMIPEPYKNTEFWQRKKAMSIDEEEIELDHTPATEKDVDDVDSDGDAEGDISGADQMHKTSSFEEATQTQNERALTALQQQKQLAKDIAEHNEGANTVGSGEAGEVNTNLQASSCSPQSNASPARSSASPRLRRSPRMDEMQSFEERWRESEEKAAAAVASSVATPTITIDPAPWRDEHGLLLEGISDFYDFTASVNPSRSRSTSRNVTPTNTAPSTPLPNDVAFGWDSAMDRVDIYDDSGAAMAGELSGESIRDFIDTLVEGRQTDTTVSLQNVSDDASRSVVLVPTVCISEPIDADSTTVAAAEEEMTTLVQSLRAERMRSRSQSRSRSRSPLPTEDNLQRSVEKRRQKLIQQNDELLEKLTAEQKPQVPVASMLENDKVEKDDNCSKDSMNDFVASLRLERTRSYSRSRSRSPLPTAENLQRSLDTRRQRLIQHNDELIEKLTGQLPATTLEMPTISIELAEATEDTAEDLSREHMSLLVESLRVARSCSRSRTPARDIMAEGPADMDERFKRDRTPSRSLSPVSSAAEEETIELAEEEFHALLNLETSTLRTLIKQTEETESILAAKQRAVDVEALLSLSNANEELELRTVTPVGVKSANSNEDESTDQLSALSNSERLQHLRCSPTTPDYERCLSAEWQHIERIKREQLTGAFKRSKYVGESMDLGSEYEQQRRETAIFQRSLSPSPPLDEETARNNATERQQKQAEILAELAGSPVAGKNGNQAERLGAKPKTTQDYDRTLSLASEVRDTQRIKAEQLAGGFQRSTYVGESVDMSSVSQDEFIRAQRSRSKSRSPLNEQELRAVERIEAEVTKRQLQDKIMDQLTLQDYPRYLNADFLDNERRASDSALLQQFSEQINEDAEFNMDPDDYHHFRRYSLAQEPPGEEEYPSDDEDFNVFLSDFELQALTGRHADYYSIELEEEEQLQGLAVSPLIEQEAGGEDFTDDSEDERQTVVEVDDEIDEDICDFLERGPTDESHHEQSECEEADRELDHYAGRDAADWAEVRDVGELLFGDGDDIHGAVGGGDTAYDVDSATIDAIYDEAIRNRKQSGIMRDYDCILKDMQDRYMDHGAATSSSNAGSESEGGRYGPPPKPREMAYERRRDADSTQQLLESEREIRYLGDAKSSARQSVRLHARHGFVPLLQGSGVEEMEVDLSYKPKREYNWRKNFKLDDEKEGGDVPMSNGYILGDDVVGADHIDMLDLRKFSLGGESITLFSRSPEPEDQPSIDSNGCSIGETYAEPEPMEEISREQQPIEEVEKPKKKKSKKKTRKFTKTLTPARDEEDEDSENQSVYNRRSSSLQLDAIDSPTKRKSRSRRSSKSSVESTSIGYADANTLGDINENFGEPIAATEIATKKKVVKKRKKVKEVFKPAADITEEVIVLATTSEILSQPATISTTVTPSTTIAALSPALSVCVTPGSVESLKMEESACTTELTNSTVAVVTTPLDTFDILKDANFYPLF